MKEMLTDRFMAQSLECEFIPPLDMPEVRGMPWEQQLSAASAWQMAGGNVDDVDPQVTMAASDRRLPTMRSITRMNTLLLSLRERLYQFQTEAANVAIGELSLRQSSTPGAPSDDAFSPLHTENVQRVEALALSCFELLASAQADLVAVTGIIPPSARSTLAQSAADASWLHAERRRSSVVIDFPDRRAA